MPNSGPPPVLRAAPFVEGELLLWEVREGAQLVRRQVGFRRLDHGRAIVAWGVDADGVPALFTAHPSELRRQAPPAPPLKIAPPAPSPPEPVAARREKLRRAHAVWLETEAVARRADELAHRARQGFVEAELDLQRLGDLEARAEAAALDRIRAGCTDPAPDIAAAEWDERETARHRRDASQSAFRCLEAEAAAAWGREREADKARRLAAKHVLAGVAQAFVDELAAIEAAAARHRAEATALSLLWLEGGSLRLGDAADQVITAGPAQVIDPVGLSQQLVEQRQTRWQVLFDRLLVDPEADLDPEHPE